MYQLVKNSIAAKALRIAALSLAMTVIAGPMEAWATGNIFYNFSFIGHAGSASGWFEVSPGGGNINFPDTIVNISGSLSGFYNGGNGPILSLFPPGDNDNLFSPNTPWVNNNGVAFKIQGPGQEWFYRLGNFSQTTWFMEGSGDDQYSSFSSGTLAVSLSQ